jgi:RND family efflux transporter MFP subunit
MNMTRHFGIVLAVVGAAACSGGTADRQAAEEGAAVSVTVDPVTLTAMPDTYEVGGVLVARQTTVVAARIMAPVVRVLVQPGDQVRRGQILVELEGEDAAAQADRAAAALASAQAMTTAATSGHAAARAALALATATHDRIAQLQKTRSATPQELDEAEAALRAAEARVDTAAAQVQAAQRGVEAAQAAVRSTTIARSWTSLTASTDGLVVARHVDAGSTVSPGQPLLTLEAPGALQMEVRVDASRASALQIGQSVDIRVDDGGASDWTPAQIAEIARVDPASHSFLVTLDAPVTSGWRSGYYARARFAEATRSRLTVSSAAVIDRGQLTFVYVVGTDGHARLRLVSTGQTWDGRVEVLSGLVEGDRVVTDPPATLTDGARVRS